MRISRVAILGVIGIAVAVGVVTALTLFVDLNVPLPRVGPDVEAVCVEAMRRTPPDLSWVAAGDDPSRRRAAKAVTLGELRGHSGELVQVAGVLHVEFEWKALYPSRMAMEESPWRGAPWVSLGSLWPNEPYWVTKAPSVSDRCVVVHGTYIGGESGGLFTGRIHNVLRLDVWSTPHRPFTIVVPPPPPASPQSSKPPKLRTR